MPGHLKANVIVTLIWMRSEKSTVLGLRAQNLRDEFGEETSERVMNIPAQLIVIEDVSSGKSARCAGTAVRRRANPRSRLKSAAWRAPAS